LNQKSCIPKNIKSATATMHATTKTTKQSEAIFTVARITSPPKRTFEKQI